MADKCCFLQTHHLCLPIHCLEISIMIKRFPQEWEFFFHNILLTIFHKISFSTTNCCKIFQSIVRIFALQKMNVQKICQNHWAASFTDSANKNKWITNPNATVIILTFVFLILLMTVEWLISDPSPPPLQLCLPSVTKIITPPCVSSSSPFST